VSRPPIEGLSDIAWQRVEKNLFAALDCEPAGTPAPRRTRTAWMFAAAGFAAAAAALLLWVLVPTRAPTTPRSDAPTTTASRVVTQDSPSEVIYGEAAILVDPSSALSMQGDAEHGVVITLERGAATFSVAPRLHRPAFTVQAGDATVRVVGTRFTVARDGDSARISVIEGHVEVLAHGQRIQLLAGESYDSSGAPAQVVQREDRHSSVESPDGLLREGQSSAGAVTADPEPSGSGTPRPRQRSSSLSSREQYEAAASLEATDQAAALAAYQKLAKGTDKWAANALFAAGRLAAELGRADAAELLDQYVARYPKGANAADARTLLRSLGH
jgi:hypothetical protein